MHDNQKVESAKGEMREVREENERLKVLLAQLVKEYESLQMHFFDILRQDHKQEEASKATDTADHSHEEDNEEKELVSLSLGFTSKDETKDEEKNGDGNKEEDENLGEGLALGLDVRFDPSASAEATNIIISPESSIEEERKEEEPTEIWPPSKVLKTMRTGENIEASPRAQLKKARVSIRARCDTQTMNDGCQWRKYGQKISKGNRCPRAYYRCTVSPSCPVRKQVQRCSEDMSILITTYEGTHNHPLPISATAMASTTSAAASMLQSPSFSSQPGLANSYTAPIFKSSTSANSFNSLNFSTCQQISRPQPFYFPNSSISTFNSHPTITLDLTAPPPPNSSHFRKFPSGFSFMPRYPSSSLNISSSTFSPLQSSIPQQPWSTNYSSYFNYGTVTHNRNQSVPLFNTGKQPSQGPFQQPNHLSNYTTSHQPLPDDTIAEATKAITTNPKFQSALAAALTTYVGNGAVGGKVRENHVGAENAALNLMLGGNNTPCRKNPVYSSSSNGDIGCASVVGTLGYQHVSSAAVYGAQQGNLMLFPPSLPSPPSSKSASDSASDRSNQLLEQWKRKNLSIAPKESNL